jgi:hypothetical protein
MRRPIGIWIAAAYLGVLALGLSHPGSALWLGSPIVVLSLAAAILSMVLLTSLNRWAVLATAILASAQAAFYLVWLVDPRRAASLLGLRSPYHDTYIIVIHSGFVPVAHLAVLAAISLYAVWLSRTGILR